MSYSCPGILFFIAATLNLTAIAETEAKDVLLPKLPALAPNAPFAESQSGPAKTFTPEVRVNSIVAGAKSLTHSRQRQPCPDDWQSNGDILHEFSHRFRLGNLLPFLKTILEIRFRHKDIHHHRQLPFGQEPQGVLCLYAKSRLAAGWLSEGDLRLGHSEKLARRLLTTRPFCYMGESL